MKIKGYAAVFNSRSLDLGGFREIVAPGAFSRTLRDGHPIFAVHHHAMADVLGSTRSGTLKLSEDRTGLYFELALPESSRGREIYESVRRGDLSSMSFSFSVAGTRGESWRETKSGGIERILKDVTLIEISTVALPAYPATSVASVAMQRSAVAQLPTSKTAYATEARNRMTRRLMASRLRVA